MNNIYSTQKILYHPDIVKQIRNGEQPYPIQIHLIPENKCNHKCLNCAYRVTNGKNTQMFDGYSSIPKNTMLRLIKDFAEMGGKAVELTGGGEPLLYKYKTEMFTIIIENKLDYALVTNGTLLTEELAKLIAPQMTWGRISIDAGTPKTYSTYRKVSNKEFYKAIQAISLLRKYSENKQFKLGVGFVVNNMNYSEIEMACELYKDAGADNVRISATFHPEGLSYYTQEAIPEAKKQIEQALLLNSPDFHVYNLFDERIGNLKTTRQPYVFCPTKELLCVVGGDCNVYLCCSLAFNSGGLIGSIKDKSFKELWDSPEKYNFFKNLNASHSCPHECMYEERNIFMNNFIFSEPAHVNFI